MIPENFTLTEARVVEIHTDAMKNYGGGDIGSPKKGCIDGAIGNAYQAAMYMTEDDEVDLLHYSVHVLYKLATNHCFVDGNKRVGWMSFLDLLERFGLTIQASQKEAEEFVLDIAKSKFDANEILNWVAERLVSDDEQDLA